MVGLGIRLERRRYCSGRFGDQSIRRWGFLDRWRFTGHSPGKVGRQRLVSLGIKIQRRRFGTRRIGHRFVRGGYFTRDDGSADYVAKWDGSIWSLLGAGLDSDVYALAVSGSDL